MLRISIYTGVHLRGWEGAFAPWPVVTRIYIMVTVKYVTDLLYPWGTYMSDNLLLSCKQYKVRILMEAGNHNFT